MKSIRRRLRRLPGHVWLVGRWLRFFTIIVWRAKGWRNRSMAIRCIVHTACASAGLCHRPREYPLRLSGFVFCVDAVRGDVGPYGSIFINHEYERDSRFIPEPGGIVLDVGAQVGFFSAMAARRVGDGRVYAFEPDPGSFARLKANVRANSLTNVEVFPLAVGPAEGKVYFECSPHSVDSRVRAAPSAHTIEVPCTSLDVFVSAHNIDRIDLLKIDTEGAELDVLRGASDVALPRTQAAIVEIHAPGLLEPIDRIMTSRGFRRVSSVNLLHFWLRAGAPVATTGSAESGRMRAEW